jgi:hypothetical protein
MLSLRPNTGSADSDVWTASAEMRGDVDEVLYALTRPASIARWAPVSFEVDNLGDDPLRTGSRERVSGSIAGIRATFEVEITKADRERLELIAHGPVSMDVTYSFDQHSDGVAVHARVSVRRQAGITAHMLRAAVGALLNAGVLKTALHRLESSMHCPVGADLLRA